MRVLYACADPGIPYWGTKGASIHIRSFTAALAESGHDVTVLMARLGRAPQSSSANVRLIEVPCEHEGFFQTDTHESADTLALLSEARQFAQNRSMQDIINDIVAHDAVDVICERYSLFGIAGREGARWHRIPFVLEVNAPLVVEQREHRRLILAPLAAQIERFLFSTAECVVAVSDPLAGYVKSIAPDANVRTIANGVDFEAFASHSDGTEWRRRWGISNDRERLIGFIGSLKPWHGLELLMAAYATLAERDASVQLVLIGDGPLRGTLEQEANERGLKKRIIFTGALPHTEIPTASQAIDVLTAPYPDMDHFYFSPLKVFEYMAAGKPIVASRIGQISELLRSEETALLVPPGDVPGMVGAISRILGDAQLARRLGDNARAVARERHGWTHRVTEWTALFDSLRLRTSPEEVGA